LNNNKPKPIIEKISLTEEQKEEIPVILEGNPTKESIDRQTKRGIKEYLSHLVVEVKKERDKKENR
jgi:hypothetical protein